MDQVELLKIYAVKLASRLGENQESIEFIAESVTDHGVETMIVEVIKNHKIREEFKREIEKIVKDGSYYAVRSSSIEEDSSNFS